MSDTAIDLSNLYERAIEHYEEFKSSPATVPNSIPILHFGDVDAYSRSVLKVVTVGLNPSNAEFPDKEDRLGNAVRASLSPDTLRESLSGYFRNNPYSRWFDRAFESLLQPLGASFYGHYHPGKQRPVWWQPQSNTALHTDIGTPIATTPKWSNLPRSTRERLQAKGFPLWRDLIGKLEPHLILISVAPQHLSLLGALKWRSFRPFEPASPPHEMSITEFGHSKIVWGRSQIMPFFHMTAEQRIKAAGEIQRQTKFQSI
jgi:hypothetical protein